jgi:hypothetical protein
MAEAGAELVADAIAQAGGCGRAIPFIQPGCNFRDGGFNDSGRPWSNLKRYDARGAFPLTPLGMKLCLEYEDLFAKDSVAVWDGLLDYPSVEPRPLAPFHMKVTNEDLTRSVKNYSEIEHLIRNQSRKRSKRQLRTGGITTRRRLMGWSSIGRGTGGIRRA